MQAATSRSLFSSVEIWNVLTINGGFYDKSTKYYLDVGQNGRPRGPQMWMSSLELTIQLLGYLILTHTHLETSLGFIYHNYEFCIYKQCSDYVEHCGTLRNFLTILNEEPILSQFLPLPLWKVKHAETGSVFPHLIFRGFMDESIDECLRKWNALGISALSAQPFTLPSGSNCRCASISAIAKTQKVAHTSHFECPGMDPNYNGCASQFWGW